MPSTATPVRTPEIGATVTASQPGTGLTFVGTYRGPAPQFTGFGMVEHPGGIARVHHSRIHPAPTAVDALAGLATDAHDDDAACAFPAHHDVPAEHPAAGPRVCRRCGAEQWEYVA